MFRPLIIATLLASGASATHAQTAGGPSIAYVKVSGSQEIWLVEPNGSGLRRVYVAPKKMAIGWVDLKPGGGEIAFTQFGSGQPRVIKILEFDDYGIPVGQARTITGSCGVDTLDYHPSEPKLIISDFCPDNPRIATINTDGTGYTVLVSNGSYVNKARWLKNGLSYVYVRSGLNGGPLDICRDSCNPDSGELLRTVGGNWFLDVGRTKDTILHDFSGSPTDEIDATTGAVLRAPAVEGNGAHYSPDDTSILYETPHSARGNYLMIVGGSGIPQRLTAKGDYGPSDWRN